MGRHGWLVRIVSGLSVAFAYRQDSSFDPERSRLGLETAGGTSLLEGRVANPRFFTGLVLDAAAAAAALQAIAQNARARHHRPAPGGARDPVVTCNGDRLRFESFSSCGGVYARLDLLSDLLDGRMHDRGTTNVDVNEPLLRMLTKVRDRLELRVGPDELTVATEHGIAVERKVALPSRWLRGFAEVQVAMAGFDLRAELPVAEAARVLRELPGNSRSSRPLWLGPSGGSLRVLSSPRAGAVCLSGTGRLGALLPLLRFARTLRVYGPAVTTGHPLPSVWELERPGLRLTVGLSPEISRGFSGEGGVLAALAGDETDSDADLVGGLLSFEPRVEVDLLAERSGLPIERVRAALAQLGTAGRVGYDLAEAAYFHRELPYDAAAAELLNPRLRNARALVAAGAVSWDGGYAVVTVGDHAHRVRLGDRPSCTCQWWASYAGSRGPCKHVLAARIHGGEAG